MKEKSIFLNLILAQIASDSGKGYKNSRSKIAEHAIIFAYQVKAFYIYNALILYANQKSKSIKIFFDPYQNVIYFNTLYGQVSFHIFENEIIQEIENFDFVQIVDQENDFVWTEFENGSRYAIATIANKYFDSDLYIEEI